MAFKSFSKYQEDKNGDFFVLPNDNDSADVVFLYQSTDDVLVADVHYLSTSSYKGYVHCCEAGCPACNYGDRGIRVDHKIFIPLYNLHKEKVEFWDRSTFFEQVLQKSVFAPFPNPSEAIFRITRHGEAGSRDTTYEIVPIYKNASLPYEQILKDFNLSFPESYSTIVKEMSAEEMRKALYSSGVSTSELQDYGYTPVPRGAASDVPSLEPTPAVTVSTPSYSAPPEVAPPLPDYDPATAASSLPDAPAASLEPGEPISASSADDADDSLDDVQF